MDVISRHRWRISITMALVLSALILALMFSLSSRMFTHAAGIGPLPATNTSLVSISSDPYTNPDSQHRTEVEPDTYAFGNTIVSAFQVGRFFNGGASNIGWATSTNAGDTWRHGFLPGTTVNANPPGTYARASDASVAYDAKHKVWLISYLGLKSPVPSIVDVLVSRSTDGGLTWGNPVPVATPNSFLDKNWTVCDDTPSSPYYGNCYTEYDDANAGDLELLSTSTDGGLTWSAGIPTANGAHGLGGQPLVLPNGTVVVPYVGLDSPFFAFTISSFSSTDGGKTLTSSTLISEADFHNPNGGIRAGIPLPTAEIDKSGKVYVVWSDCRFEASCSVSDLVLSTSTNGTNWSPVKRIPVDPVGSGVDHFIPGLAVDRNSSGHLGLAYYFYPNGSNCTATTCKLEVGFLSSINGGSSWSKSVQLAGPMMLSWLPVTTQGVMVGDYISTSIVPGDDDATPVFAVAHAPHGTTFAEAIYTTSEDLLKVVGGSSSSNDQPVSHGGLRSTGLHGQSPTAY